MKICPAGQAVMDSQFLVKFIRRDVIIAIPEKLARHFTDSSCLVVPDIGVNKFYLCSHLHNFMVNYGMFKGNRRVFLEFDSLKITCPEETGDGSPFYGVVVVQGMKNLLIVGNNPFHKGIFGNQ
ncbi:MAG: hypothetical protein A3D92_16245 [Bacteroidetes bacterium RIFCSPHIGHO2_02_FULL_44_7]|nr:MAG: hypothetical protein A3D92_16245 [Bacteroidetes bacterium RIFCSPHIGHO2_02_FULL_44_7]